MKVFRVEDADHHGPYSSEDGWFNYGPELAYTGQDMALYPTPPYEGGALSRHWGEAYRFGFKSLDQLKEWFKPRARKAMAKFGLHVEEYKVPDNEVFEGNLHRQVTFTAAKAEPVKALELTAI